MRHQPASGVPVRLPLSSVPPGPQPLPQLQLPRLSRAQCVRLAETSSVTGIVRFPMGPDHAVSVSQHRDSKQPGHPPFGPPPGQTPPHSVLSSRLQPKSHCSVICVPHLTLRTLKCVQSRAGLPRWHPKHPPTNPGDATDKVSIPGLGRSPGGGHGNPLQYSWLENPRDSGAW